MAQDLHGGHRERLKKRFLKSANEWQNSLEQILMKYISQDAALKVTTGQSKVQLT